MKILAVDFIRRDKTEPRWHIVDLDKDAIENVKKLIGKEYISTWKTVFSAKEYKGGTEHIASRQ